jgi:CHAT domain-containing protein
VRKLLILILSFCYFSSKGQDNNIALLSIKSSVSQFESKGDTLNNDYLILLNNLAHLYKELGNISQAEKIFLKTLKIRQEKFGINHLDVAKSLIHLSDLYFSQGRYNDAEPYCIKAIAIRKVLLGEKSSNYIESLGKLANIYSEQKKYFEAEEIFLEGLRLKKEIYEVEHPSYLLSLQNLTSIYNNQGKFSESEKYYLHIIEILKKANGEKHLDYINALNNLAVVYFYQEKYLDAEISYLNVIELMKSILNDQPSVTPNYINSLNNLAELYRLQKKYTESKKRYEEAIQISELKTKDDIKVQITLKHNLALLYVDLKEYELAGDLLIETLELIKKKYGKANLMYASTLGNIASLAYYYEENIEVIIPLLASSLQIRKEIVGVNHPLYIQSLFKLATAYKQAGKYSAAEQLLLNALEICKEIYDENHQQYINCLIELSILYRDLKLNDKASHYFNSYLISNKVRIKEISSTFVEEELTNYVISNKLSFEESLIFINEHPIQYPKININYFDNVILLKNLSLKNLEIIKKAIEKSNNKSIQEKYRKFLDNKRVLLKIQELPINKQPIYLEKLKIEKDKLEKELVHESTYFSESQNKISRSSNDLIDKLKPNEIVIDFVSFSYNLYKAKDSVLYAAFIVGKNYKFPKFITLFEEKQLALLLDRNKNQQVSSSIDKQYLDKAISDLFLKPLEKELEGVSTIYLSPSGLGYQINFAALPVNANQTLGNKYKLHILSSPVEFIDYKVEGLDKKSNLELLIYGDIDYDKTNSVINKSSGIAANKETLKELQTRSGISEFGYLAGSKKEVEQINNKAKQNGFQTTLLNDRVATEESIKQLDGRTIPFILHLATHGFFFPNPIKEAPKDILDLEGKSKIYKASDDPMMRSGLLFSGANKYWGKNIENTTAEDGILTASEISNLDLSACQLVVLSACETGLGEVKGSEGVFGLQRAFKMAGVKNIIMSLWKVPDAQTAELFEIFYDECFAGKSIHEAFRAAQSKMKAKYSPYYWAGFVLLE